MLFNHGGGFFTPKNFQLPQHFTPKTMIAQSTTTNESCSLMLDSDVRSVTYVLKSSKESTIQNDTNSTYGDNKNIKMIEYEEYEKSNSPSLKSSVDIRNHYIKEIIIGGEGKLIAEGTLSHADSEERNVITPSNQYYQQFDFKINKQQINESDSQNIKDMQNNNLLLNDHWMKQMNLSNEQQQMKDIYCQSSNDIDKENIDQEKNRRCNSNSHDNLDNKDEQLQELFENKQLIQQEDKSFLNERNKRIEKNKEQNNYGNSYAGQKSKILVQDQIYQENIIYEEEDSENSKSTDRQYNLQNQISQHYQKEQLSLLNNNMSSEKDEHFSKTKNNQNNSSKQNSIQCTQVIQAFSIEEEIGNEQQISSQKQEELKLQSKQSFNIQQQHQQQTYKSYEIEKSQNNEKKLQQDQQQSQKQNIQSFENGLQNQYKQDENMKIQKISNQHLQIQQQQRDNQLIQQRQNQNQNCVNNNIKSRESRNNFFQNNKQNLNINNINFQDECINIKPYQNQNFHPEHEYFVASKKNVQEDNQQNNIQNLKQNQDQKQDKIGKNKHSQDDTMQNIRNIKLIHIQEQYEQNTQPINESGNKQLGSDKIYYPSNIHKNDLESLSDQNQLQNNQKNKKDDPSQKLNFDQCESSVNSSSMKDEEDNDSILLKQNFQNLISNYKQRNQSFPQLNSNNTSRNSNFNNSNIKESNQDSNNNQNKISNYQIAQKQQTEEEYFDESHQKRFRNGQYSAILKKLEETLDMNSESDFYLIKKLQISHCASQQISENDISHIQQQNQCKKINTTINQTYILEETGEDFIFNSKEVERLEQIDNSFLLNNKENMGCQNSSLNLDSKALLADTIYSSNNNSHLYFINISSSDKRTLRSQKKEVKSNQKSQIDFTQPIYQHQNQNQFNQNNKHFQNSSQQQFTENNHFLILNQNNNNKYTFSEQSNLQNGQRQKRSSTISNLNRQQQQDQEIKLNNDFKEIDYLKKEVIKLNKDLKNIDIQNSKYQEIIDQQQSNILRLEEKLIHYKDELKNKQHSLENKDMQVSKLFEEKEQLKTKKNKLKESLKEKDSQILQLKKIIQSSEIGIVQKLQKELEEKQGIVNQQNIQFSEIQKKYTEQNLQLKARTQEISHLKKEIEFNRNSENIFSQQVAQSIIFDNQLSNSQINCNNNPELNRIQNINNLQQNSSNVIINQEKQNNVSDSSSFSQSSSSSNQNQKKQYKTNNSNSNEQRLRSYSYNESKQNQYENINRVPVINQNQLTTSQPYNLTEESQNIRMSTQIDSHESHENLNNHIRMLSSSSYSHSNYNNQINNLNNISDKVMYSQMRHSYDNHKCYQKDNQQILNTNSNSQQPMTLNSAIAQYKIQALDERKRDENSTNNNNTLIKQQQNPSDLYKTHHKKQFDNISQSSAFNGSESQFANKSHISTSCNSRHMESSNTQYTNSQMCSNNTSQKSLNQQQSRQHNNIQYLNKSTTNNQISISNQQIHFQNQIESKSKLRNRTSEKLNDQAQSNSFTQLNSFSNKPQNNERPNMINQPNHLKENKQQMITSKYNQNQFQQINDKQSHNFVQDQRQFNNNHQNSSNTNNLSYERTKTSPNKSQQQLRNKIVDTSEYNSVPLCSNNNQLNESLNQIEQYNRINGNNQRKLSSNGIDLASINQKINSNYQLIESLSLNNKNKQDQSQHSNQQSHHLLQNNYVDPYQNEQYRLKREQSYSYHESTNSKSYSMRNPNQQQNLLLNQYNITNSGNNMNDANCKQISKKPPRSSNEMRQSIQFNNQSLLEDYQQNNNENQQNAGNIDVKNINQYQKQYNQQLNQYDKRNVDSYQHQNTYSQQNLNNQQHVIQTSQRVDKFHK